MHYGMSGEFIILYMLDIAALFAVMLSLLQHIAHQFVPVPVAGTVFECGVSRPASFGLICANWVPLVMVFLLFEVELLILIPISVAIGCGFLRITAGLIAFLLLLVVVFVVEWFFGAFTFHA